MIHDAFARFFINWCLVVGGQCLCPNCAGDRLYWGYFDFILYELGPDAVRAGYCFDCNWAVYESGRLDTLGAA